MSRSITVASVVLTGFFFCVSLPANPHIPGPWKQALVSYLACPVVILLFLRMNPLRNGLGLGNWRTGLWLSFLASLAVLFSCFFFARVPAMKLYYAAPRWGSGSAAAILLAEYDHLSAGSSCFGAFCCSRWLMSSAPLRT
jgi:hypothetical protein